MRNWTFFTGTNFAHVPAEVKSTKTRNSTQIMGIKEFPTPEEKMGRLGTCVL
jgi:hypothetical protein